MNEIYTYEPNEDGELDILEDRDTVLLSIPDEEDVAINLVEHLNDPTGRYYSDINEANDSYRVYDSEGYILVAVESEHLAEKLLMILNRN